jgi:uncharacterized protein YutE (UPF0331/DUF86 family)
LANEPGAGRAALELRFVFQALEQSDVFKPHMTLLRRLFQLRNMIVHGDRAVRTEELNRASNELEQFFQLLKQEKLTDPARAIVEAVKFS